MKLLGLLSRDPIQFRKAIARQRHELPPQLGVGGFSRELQNLLNLPAKKIFELHPGSHLSPFWRLGRDADQCCIAIKGPWCCQNRTIIMRHQAFLREQAERCFRLADTAQDPRIARELRAIAEAFLAKAAELDGKTPDRTD
jgi:hypothetical protein